MANVIVGNHAAVVAARSAREQIRKFYCDVPGCVIRQESDEVNRFQLNSFHFCFVYNSDSLDKSDFLKAIHLDLMTNDTEELKQKILAFGVKTLNIPDPHLYFQAPGGQMFRVVDVSEDLSPYERSPSSRPASARR